MAERISEKVSDGKITSHKTESVYRRYAIVSERDVAEGLETLGGVAGGGGRRGLHAVTGKSGRTKQ